MSGRVSVMLPMRLVSEANCREHWRVVAKRKRGQRQAVRIGLLSTRMPSVAIPCTVTLCRYSPRQLDSDNLQSACKAVRDEIAAWLGIDDRSPLVTWVYQQAPTKSLGLDARMGDHILSIIIEHTP